MLDNMGIQIIFKLLVKIQILLRCVKDDLGAYHIPCERRSHPGQTGRSIIERCSEHQKYKRLHQPEKSGLAWHPIDTGHNVCFSSETIIMKMDNSRQRVIRESIELQRDTEVVNCEVGLQFSRS